jgi:cytochrome c556
MLNEHFREMARQAYEKYDDDEFAEAMTHAVDATTQLSKALAANNAPRASAAFALVAKSCKDCHYDWRD